MAEKTPNNTKRTKRVATVDNNYGHLQPQATEIERLVLGALMIDKEAFSIVSEILRPEAFYDPRHQKIYHAIQSLNLNEKPVDIETVNEQLRHEGTLEEVGGTSYVLELSSRVVSSAHIEYHSQIISKKYIARQLISYASKLETDAFDETIDVEDLMQDAEKGLFELSQKNMRQDFTQIAPVLSQAVAILQEARKNENGMTGVPTGFKELDDKTSGWQKSDLVIIAGRPAMGKTSFALSIAKSIAVDYRKPVAFFSLEMNNVQLVNRLISNTCEIDSKKILSGQIDDDEWARIDKNIRKMEGAPLFLDETPGLSIFELRSKARRLVREKNVELIMIDYLQLMNASGTKFGNRQEEVSTISRSLKGLAKELDIPILALSQLNRQVDTRDKADGKRPQLSDLRESGAIEQDADMVIFVHRPEVYGIYEDERGNDLHGKAQIILAKHRKGAIGDILLRFRGEYTRFQDLETGYNSIPITSGGEIVGSRMNSEDSPMDMPTAENTGIPF